MNQIPMVGGCKEGLGAAPCSLNATSDDYFGLEIHCHLPSGERLPKSLVLLLLGSASTSKFESGDTFYCENWGGCLMSLIKSGPRGDAARFNPKNVGVVYWLY